MCYDIWMWIFISGMIIKFKYIIWDELEIKYDRNILGNILSDTRLATIEIE